MNVEALSRLILVAVLWAVCGFIGFCMEIKRDGSYTKFDEAEELFALMISIGFLSFIMEILFLLAKIFHDGMDKLIDKINKM